MVIEIIPKPKFKKIPWINIIFYTLLVLFLVFLISYLVIISYQKKLTQELANLEKSLIRTPEQDLLEEKILGYQQKISDFTPLLINHQFPVKLFKFLEENTHPQIWFSKFDFDATNNQVRISGQAANFEVLGHQTIIFQTKDLIREVNLSEVSISKEKGIEFTFLLTFDPQILK